jgi:hypothetical protein
MNVIRKMEETIVTSLNVPNYSSSILPHEIQKTIHWTNYTFKNNNIQVYIVTKIK